MTHAWRKAAIALLTMVLIVALAAPAMAAKKKSRKSDDPMKGRISIGGTVGGGGGTGETLAFVAQLSLTYWFNKYLSTTVASGYGQYGAEYIDYQNEVEDTTVRYIPSEITATLYPLPGMDYSPYVGGGVGADYIWYNMEDFTGPGEDESQAGTVYSGIARAGVSIRLGSNGVASAGIRYTQPVSTSGDIDLEDDDQGYISFEGGFGFFF